MSEKCCTNSELNIKYARLARLFRIIGDDNRLRILCLLSKKERCVCEISSELKIAQNLVSSHLKIMLDFSLLKVKQAGKRNYYNINRKTFKKYNKIIINFLKTYE